MLLAAEPLGGMVDYEDGQFIAAPAVAGGTVAFTYTAVDSRTGLTSLVEVEAFGGDGTALTRVKPAGSRLQATLLTGQAGGLASFVVTMAALQGEPASGGGIEVRPWDGGGGSGVDETDAAILEDWLKELEDFAEDQANSGDPTVKIRLETIKEHGLVLYVVRDDPNVLGDNYDPYGGNPGGTVDVGDGEKFPEGNTSFFNRNVFIYHVLVDQFERNHPQHEDPSSPTGEIDQDHEIAIAAETEILGGGYKRTKKVREEELPDGSITTTWTHRGPARPQWDGGIFSTPPWIDVIITRDGTGKVISVTQEVDWGRGNGGDSPNTPIR